MITQKVHSDNGGREGKWVALSIILILLVSAVLLPYHKQQSTTAELAQHQIAVADIEQKSLGLIADLRLAHEEVRNLYFDALEQQVNVTDVDLTDSTVSQWVNIAELRDMWLPPFIEDKSWEFQGKHQWTLIAPATYQGIAQTHDGAKSLVLIAAHEEPEIWLDLNNNAAPITASEKVISDQMLIDASWIQIAFEQSGSAPHGH
ncbi:DUF6162 family protein [Photobacterium sanguinicancri]|uniref:Uncharacterized protein n=1 Tax=Photobacterium sanguinicancri TaxID=875932 RepID=A0AAW7Y1S5_9GAMM|nr:hypothetical protein [Photobacterium sanguinicancri]KXI24377.1 hypothetical protein AS132_01800 [Photobacterium sanguinicancri]MDO6541676.1 hypothetical protein [Photobacterium sanguinicancri]